MILTMDGKNVKKIESSTKKEIDFTKGIDNINQLMKSLSDEFFIFFFKDKKMFSLSNLSKENTDIMLNELYENQTRQQIREIIDEIEIESILDEYGLDYADLESMDIQIDYGKEEYKENEDDKKDDE